MSTATRTNLDSPTMSVRQIAREASVTDATVRVWINSGKLPAYKLPGSGAQSIIRVNKEDWRRFLDTYKSTAVGA